VDVEPRLGLRTGTLSLQATPYSSENSRPIQHRCHAFYFLLHYGCRFYFKDSTKAAGLSYLIHSWIGNQPKLVVYMVNF